MPELSEVFVTADDIGDKILGKHLRGLFLHGGSRYCKNGVLNLEERIVIGTPQKSDDGYFYEVTGLVTDVFTYCKKFFIKIVTENENEYYISSFLSMYGTWRFDKNTGAKHTLVFSDFEDKNEIGLFYHDTRNWGIFCVVKNYKS